MLTKKLYKILGENNDLGNKLHSYYIYKCNKNKQIKTKQLIESILKNKTPLSKLAYNKTTKTLIKKLNIKEKTTKKILKALIDLLEREIKQAKPIPKPKNIKNKLKKLPIYKKEDLIKIKQDKDSIKVNYLSKRFSPDYNPKKLSYNNEFESWRDTQFIFTLNFKKNLFIWDYINVSKQFHGKKIGTKTVLFIEKLAKQLGFTRFSVEYPNRQYWIKKLNYKIPYKYRVGSGKRNYTLEGYKEI